MCTAPLEILSETHVWSECRMDLRLFCVYVYRASRDFECHTCVVSLPKHKLYRFLTLECNLLSDMPVKSELIVHSRTVKSGLSQS